MLSWPVRKEVSKYTMCKFVMLYLSNYKIIKVIHSPTTKHLDIWLIWNKNVHADKWQFDWIESNMRYTLEGKTHAVELIVPLWGIYWNTEFTGNCSLHNVE